MRFEPAPLVEAIRRCCVVYATNKDIMKNPGIQFTPQGAAMLIETSDGEVAVRCRVDRLDEDDPTPEKFILSALQLRKFFDHNENHWRSIQLDVDANEVEFTIDLIKAKFVRVRGTMQPLPKMKPAEMSTIPSFGRHVAAVAWARSRLGKNGEVAAKCGVLIATDHVAATDLFSGAMVKVNTGLSQDYVVSSPQIAKVLAGTDEDSDVMLGVNENGRLFASPRRGIQYSMPTMGGEFPPLQKVLANRNHLDATIDGKALLKCLQRSSAWASEDNALLVSILIENTELKITTPDGAGGGFYEALRIPNCGFEEPILVRLNAQSAINCLAHIKGEAITMSFPNGPKVADVRFTDGDYSIMLGRTKTQ